MIPKGKTGEDIPEEIQKEMLLEMLDLIMVRCERLGLKCMLTWGTLLGAVRHQGLIPWDDDIDVMMSRDDYEVFKEDVLKNPLADNVAFIDPDHPVSKFLPYMVGKIGRKDTVIHYPGYGSEFELYLAIDVFPMDNAPDDDEEWLSYIEESRESVRQVNYCVFMPSKDQNPLRYRLSLLSKKIRTALKYKGLIEKRKEIVTRYRNSKTDHIAFPANFDGGWKDLRFEKSVVDETVKLKFGDKEYNAPTGYDAFLRQTYGNYMQLPPVEERVSRHDYSDIRWR